MASNRRSERHVRTLKATLSTRGARRRVAVQDGTGVFELGPGGRVTDVLAPPAKPQAGAEEYGASGTLNFSGWISGEDYNPKLDGVKALDVYDEMRRSDAQVHASLLAIKLPLLSATWTVTPPKGGDSQDQAIADFVKACLLDDDAMAAPWLRTLQHFLLMEEFGFSVAEKVWTVGDAIELEDDDGSLTLATPIRLKRLAPRLPRTVQRWMVNPDGHLQSIIQFAPKDGAFRYWTIPAEYAVVIVRDREGDNYYGRSALRSAYMHWFYKTQAYRIAGVGLDRMGIGIPRATYTKEFKQDGDALKKVEQTLRGLRTHERGYVLEPPGLSYSFLTTTTGKSFAADLPVIVDHHNTMIARNVLAGFMAQHEQKYGSKASTASLADLFISALKGEATLLGAEIKQQVIRQLCDFNFNMRGRKYPTLDAADLSSVNVTELADRLNKLAAGKLITPDDDLEDYLREIDSLPPLPEDLRGQSRSSVAVPPAFAAAGPAAPAAAPGEPAPPAPATVAASARAARAGYVDHGTAFGRPPTDLERRVFALHQVPARLDQEHAALLRRLTEIRRKQLRGFASKLAKKDARPTAAFTDMRRRHVGSLPGVDEIKSAIREAQDRIEAFGAEQVRAELRKQGAPIKAAKSTPGTNRRTATSALVTSAQTTAEKQVSTWQARIMETAIRLRRTGLQGDDLRNKVIDVLEPEAESGAKRDAAAEVNEAFAVGREGEATRHQDIIEKVVYSALLDENTCDTCEEWDGTEMEIGSDDYYESLPPNKDCEGNKGTPDACRCVHLYIFDTSGEE